MAESRVPRFRHNVPTLNHEKVVPYLEYPLVHNDTVTQEPFYIEFPFTIVSSDQSNTTLYKWNGGGWTEVKGWDNPEKICGRGFFSVTTAANAYVLITEHF